MRERARLRGRPQQIPSVPFQIQKHCEPAVWLIARRRNELDATSGHAPVGGLEIIDPQEQSDSTGKLPSDDCRLLVAIRACEQNARPTSRRTNHDPAFGPSIIGQRWCILRQLELQNVDEKPDSGLIITNHQRDEFEVRHGGKNTCSRL
jgi:hypothetical protein